ncbi:hypothetical protein Q0F98_16135 [Paenibacillus amylolyticus]|nr:hypothetical protein Q0F98_16135 [Paenibacillus amylolyticus]
MAKQLITPSNPSENEVITLEHSLRMLNYSEILEVLQQNKFSISESIRKKRDLEKLLSKAFQNRILPEQVYIALRERAFNPELNVSDGFYLAFSYQLRKLNQEYLESLILEANEALNENQDNYKAEIKLLNFSNQSGKLLFTRKQEKFAYDRSSMFSTKFSEEQKVLVEINFSKKLSIFKPLILPSLEI